jgi:hypothetical protein
LEQIILKQLPSNPYSDIGEIKIQKGLIIESNIDSIIKETKDKYYKIIDSRKFLLYIPDTLFSLNKVIKNQKWIYKGEDFEPMYRSLIRNGNLKELTNIKIDSKNFKNTWKYSVIDTNFSEYPDSINYLKLNISRVCFNKSKTLGFFYIEVLDYSNSGYVTLILIQKKKYDSKWRIVNGTYYD